MRNHYAMMDPKSLRPSGYNPNVLSADQRAQLAGEIGRQGRLLKPVVCRDDGGQLQIIDGEHNWSAALEMGLAEIPVEVVEVDDFEARRQTFVRNLAGRWHAVRLGRMFQQMLAGRPSLSNRDLATELGCSEGTVRNILLFAKAADLCDGDPTEDDIAAMGIKEVRKLVARLEGLADDGEGVQQQPGAAEQETRILGRLKRAWNAASEDERAEFVSWTGITAQISTALIARMRAEARQPDEPDGEEPRNAYAERGARIRTARLERGLKVKELAELAGIAPATASMVEGGRLTKSGGPVAGRPAFAKLEAALGLS